MKTPLLEIEDLYARVGDKEIIKGFNLTINEGEVHAIMGPNGAGKSTLSYVLSGKPGYEVTGGSVRFKGKNLLAMPAEERAREGVFLIMQYPVEIPGVPTSTFLKHAVNAVRAHRNEPELDNVQFIKLLREEGKKLGIDNDMLKRFVNVGFSGGEKKRLEPCRWRFSNRRSLFWMKPIPVWILMLLKLWPTASMRCVTNTGPCWSSPTISGC